MTEEEKTQKIKLCGSLYTTRQVVGLIRDVAILIFLLVAIFGIIFLATFASQIKLPF